MTRRRGGKRADVYAAMADNNWVRLERPCDLCGRSVCYNNFPDRRGRQKRYIYKGKFLCPYCDPRVLLRDGRRHETRVRNRRGYRTLMSVVLTERLSKEPCTDFIHYDMTTECGTCLPCMARKLMRIEV